MKTYRVKWEIDVEAKTPREAAEWALRIQRDRESTATVFSVDEWMDSKGLVIKPHTVDLQPDEVQLEVQLDDAPIFCQDCKQEVEAITRTRRDGVQQCSECVLAEEGPQA